ncbi:hypothetical protein GYH30_020305 [Glycine max]|nr:hypothetical protein GYH30_020305 [Glycine max]
MASSDRSDAKSWNSLFLDPSFVKLFLSRIRTMFHTLLLHS